MRAEPAGPSTTKLSEVTAVFTGAPLSFQSGISAVSPEGLGQLAFDPARDLIFDFDRSLPGHANGMILMATDAQGDVIGRETFYSIGGGFVLVPADREGYPAGSAVTVHLFDLPAGD